MNSKKIRGPRIDPCETPDKTPKFDELLPPTTTFWVLPLRYYTKNLSEFPSIP
jgi:hypothetical protein